MRLYFHSTSLQCFARILASEMWTAPQRVLWLVCSKYTSTKMQRMGVSAILEELYGLALQSQACWSVSNCQMMSRSSAHSLGDWGTMSGLQHHRRPVVHIQGDRHQRIWQLRRPIRIHWRRGRGGIPTLRRIYKSGLSASFQGKQVQLYTVYCFQYAAYPPDSLSQTKLKIVESLWAETCIGLQRRFHDKFHYPIVRVCRGCCVH